MKMISPNKNTRDSLDTVSLMATSNSVSITFYAAWDAKSPRGGDFACLDHTLIVFAVEFLGRERIDVDTIQATHIDSHHWCTILSDTAAKRLHTADIAEKMVDDLLIKLIIDQMIFSG